MELTDRKKQILKVVVESYIETAEPVGSKAIAEKMASRVSSATIRNELADLEELGYLEKPHTSAGRIPSPKGYRLYVNELMEKHALSLTETEKINAAMQVKMAELDQVISKAGQMVSTFVDYPTFAAADHKERITVKRFEQVRTLHDFPGQPDVLILVRVLCQGRFSLCFQPLRRNVVRVFRIVERLEIIQKLLGQLIMAAL